MSDLIDRNEVIEIIESVCSADDSYWQPGTLEKIRNLPTHETPSNTLDISVCVDKQAVIDEISRLINDKHHIKIGTSTFRDGVIDGYARVLSMVKRLPSVQPRKGKWIKDRDGIYHCSCCNTDYLIYEWAMKDTHYCPNCGCRMEEGDSDD